MAMHFVCRSPHSTALGLSSRLGLGSELGLQLLLLAMILLSHWCYVTTQLTILLSSTASRPGLMTWWSRQGALDARGEGGGGASEIYPSVRQDQNSQHQQRLDTSTYPALPGSIWVLTGAQTRRDEGYKDVKLWCACGDRIARLRGWRGVSTWTGGGTATWKYHFYKKISFFFIFFHFFSLSFIIFIFHFSFFFFFFFFFFSRFFFLWGRIIVSNVGTSTSMSICVPPHVGPRQGCCAKLLNAQALVMPGQKQAQWNPPDIDIDS